MSKSRNDAHRNKFRNFDDEYDYRENSRERSQHRRDKRITNALRARDISTLYDLDEDE